MKTLLIIDHEERVCRFYINCATKKQAKEKGMKISGELYKFNSKEEAEKEANYWGNCTDGTGYNFNYTVF